MRIDIRSVNNMTVDELVLEISAMQEPALLVDARFKILAKSRLANECFSGIRKGTSIKLFLSEEDACRISEMKGSSLLNAEFSDKGSTFGGMVICKENVRIIVLRPLFSKVVGQINNYYGRMSGYDSSVSVPFEKQAREMEFAETLGELFDSMDFLTGLPFFNASSVIRALEKEIEKFPKKVSARFKFEVSENELITDGSDRAFALIAVFAASLLAEYGSEKTSILLSGKNNAVTLTITGSALISEGLPKGFIKNPSEMDEASFRLYMIKLLADQNLWDFKVCDVPPCNAALVLEAPLVKKGEEFAIRDVSLPFIKKLISLLLH